ncbi:MAG TPA: hypothetical protein VHI13_12610 [Candidatus Kapabacteria bacterium]|nr:hypothetical protein [Candidatus Kapabacteria bacterium]
MDHSSDRTAEEFTAELQRRRISRRTECRHARPEQRLVVTDAGAAFTFATDSDYLEEMAKENDHFLLVAWCGGRSGGGSRFPPTARLPAFNRRVR